MKGIERLFRLNRNCEHVIVRFLDLDPQLPCSLTPEQSD